MERSNSFQITAPIALLLAIVAGILAIIALSRVPSITTNEIVDGTIATQDLATGLDVGLQLSDGQLILGQMVTRDFDTSKNDGAVLGLDTTYEGIPVLVIDNKLVVENSEVEKIATDVIEGSDLNADLLDDKDSSYFTNISNVTNGNLSTNNYSAYSDLFSEGYLNLDNDNDLVTRGQSNGLYVNIAGDTMTGPLTINSSLDVNGLTTLKDTNVNGDLSVTGLSTFTDINQTGDTDHTGDYTLTGNLTVDGHTILGNGDDLVVANGFIVLAPTANLDGYNGPDTYSIGNLVPVPGGTWDLGSPQLRWRRGFFTEIVRIGEPGHQISIRDNDNNGNGAINKQGSGDLVIRTSDGGEDIVLQPATSLVQSDAHIDPTFDNTYELGNPGKRWSTVYAYTFDGDLTGCVTSPAGSVYCDNANIVGDTTIGDSNADEVVFNGRVASDFIPTTNDTFNLGGGVNRFQNGFFSNSARIGQAGDQTILSNGQLSRVGGSLDIQTTTNDSITFSPNGNTIMTITDGVAEAVVPAANYEVSIAGDLEVTGVIDPNAIELTPVNDNDIAIDVKDTDSISRFSVDENGNVVANKLNVGNLVSDKLNIGGGYGDTGVTIQADGDVLTNGNLSVDGALDVDADSYINAQLTVNDLVVTGFAQFQSTIDSDLVPDQNNTYKLGSNSSRWQNVFSRNGNFSNTVTVGTLMIGATDVAIELDALDGRIGTLEAQNLNTRLSNTESAITALQARKQIVAGVDTACIGTADTAGYTCTINAGANIASITFTAITTSANPSVSIILSADPTGSSSASIRVTGSNDVVTGISWMAVLQ